MTYEVEKKCPLDKLTSIDSQLRGLGARPADPIVQIDTYFSHPARDFATTDEALRIRSVGEQNFITYKGPKLDTTAKIREEIELPIASGASGAARFRNLLAALGFREVFVVKKNRTPWMLEWENRRVEIAVDEVDQLGRFVELELSAEEHELDAARATLDSLAKALGLTISERRSYLELLLGSSWSVKPKY